MRPFVVGEQSRGSQRDGIRRTVLMEGRFDCTVEYVLLDPENLHARDVVLGQYDPAVLSDVIGVDP